MLLRLLPEQSATYWDSIKVALLSAPPPASEITPKSLNEVLMRLLEDSMQCWISYKKTDKETIVEGIVLTTLIVDLCTDTKNLLLYCVYAFRGTEQRTWVEGLDALRKYAKSLGCFKIIGYSYEEGLGRLAERLGGEAAYLISVPCDGGDDK